MGSNQFKQLWREIKNNIRIVNKSTISIVYTLINLEINHSDKGLRAAFNKKIKKCIAKCGKPYSSHKRNYYF